MITREKSVSARWSYLRSTVTCFAAGSKFKEYLSDEMTHSQMASTISEHYDYTHEEPHLKSLFLSPSCKNSIYVFGEFGC